MATKKTKSFMQKSDELYYFSQIAKLLHELHVSTKIDYDKLTGLIKSYTEIIYKDNPCHKK